MILPRAEGGRQDRKEVTKIVLLGFVIGIAATAATWIVVRLFPKQKYPKDNALVAAIGFGGAYFVSFAGWCLLYV